MAAPLPFAVLRDCLYCLGIGVALALLRDVAGLLLGEGHLRTFAMDVLAFALAAVAIFGYAAGASAGGLARWYMAGASGLGALAWHGALTPVLRWAAAAIQNALLLPCLWGRRWGKMQINRLKSAALHRKKQRKNDEIGINDKKMLQNAERMLYN